MQSTFTTNPTYSDCFEHVSTQRSKWILETIDGFVPLVSCNKHVDQTKPQVFRLDYPGRALKLERNYSQHHRSTKAGPFSRAYQEPDAPVKARTCTHDYADHGLTSREQPAMDLTSTIQASFPQEVVQYQPRPAGQKQFCTYWIRHGECDYTQQGCRYKHEMPDLLTLNKIGFKNTPRWYLELTGRNRLRQPLRLRHDASSKILQSISPFDDAASETGSVDSKVPINATQGKHYVLPLTNPEPQAADFATSKPEPKFALQEDLLGEFSSDDETQSGVLHDTPETSTYAVPKFGLSRQGRFVPAGEEIPLLSPLRPSAPSSASSVRSNEPKVTPFTFTPEPHSAPKFNYYFAALKACKSQKELPETKDEDTSKPSPSADKTAVSDKDACITALEAQIKELSAIKKSKALASKSSSHSRTGLPAKKWSVGSKYADTDGTRGKSKSKVNRNEKSAWSSSAEGVGLMDSKTLLETLKIRVRKVSPARIEENDVVKDVEKVSLKN